MTPGAPRPNRNSPPPDSEPEAPEVEIAELRRRDERLESLVSRLRRQRDEDDPAIEHASWDRRQREIGMVVGVLILVVLLPLMLCNR